MRRLFIFRQKQRYPEDTVIRVQFHRTALDLDDMGNRLQAKALAVYFGGQVLTGVILSQGTGEGIGNFKVHSAHAVCQEYGKSVLKNAKFYGGEKGAYLVHKDGCMTHRDILRRDLDEALSKVAFYTILRYNNYKANKR